MLFLYQSWRAFCCLIFFAAFVFNCSDSQSSVNKSVINSLNDIQHTAIQTAIVESMKNAEKGPFQRIRWFCNDGTVLPPTPYACLQHGGGRQHGEWSQQTLDLRNQGYPIATVYAALNQENFEHLSQHSEELAFMLLERFMITVDDGWIFRHANSYRGALQVEAEVSKQEDLVRYLVTKPEWLTNHYFVLRETLRLLASEKGSDDFSEIRELASELAKSYKDFVPVRNKIHNRPDIKDRDRVANFIRSQKITAEIPEANLLIEKINTAFELPDWSSQLIKVKNKAPIGLKQKLTELSLLKAETLNQQIFQLAMLMAELRNNLNIMPQPQDKVAALRLSITLERSLFILFSRIQAIRDDSRQERLKLVAATTAVTYGVGLISQRQYQALNQKLESLNKNELNLKEYKNTLEYLTQISSWAAANLHLHFASAMQKMIKIEPRTNYYDDDRLRTSVLLFASVELETLVSDANRLSGLTHQFFDQEIGKGLRRLNPGLARGKLVMDLASQRPEKNQIILVPETTETLPPVAGILTAKEGNALSHVQLLARNLGIPNSVISAELMSKLAVHADKTIVFASSPGGAVHLLPDSPEWDNYFKSNVAPTDIQIKPDMQKLDLQSRQLISLSKLKATDSGRVVGPKAANLGQLKSLFPDAVTDGMALPFGLFKYYLDKPYLDSQQSTYQWMLQNYTEIRKLENDPVKFDPVKKDQLIKVFLAELRSRIESFTFEPALIAELTHQIELMGGLENNGVFIRSDTNVEDLPGFTGAGLNLTLSNVRGLNNVFEGIKKVWASPFSERAFAWRQSHMPQPEHVYTAVLLLRSVNSTASGVMVTSDLNSGDTNYLTIAVNEGVGGAVDNQAAETLLVDISSGKVNLLQQASANLRRQLSEEGGLQTFETSRTDTILNAAAIKKLLALNTQITDKYPQFINAQGNRDPADIEFGFVDDKLVLFQIRPFLQNPQALKNDYLIKMDANLTDLSNIKVELSAPISEGLPQVSVEKNNTTINKAF